MHLNSTKINNSRNIFFKRPFSFAFMEYLDFIRDNSNESVFLRASELFKQYLNPFDSKLPRTQLQLPQIDSILINGLYPYKNDEQVELTKGKANVVYGGNGSGKTTAINCIEFGLLGSNAFFEIKSTFSKRIINKFDVKAFLRFNHKPYLLQRTMNPLGEGHHPVLK